MINKSIQPEEMAKQREIFCKGARENGVNAEVASHIFDLMEKFAGYGFNKSHSASYALIAYQTAWLKVHYPAAFMAAVLSSDMDRTEKILLFLEECQSQQLKVTPPDINKSDYFFKMVDDKNLLYGLGAIKGLGAAAIENIISARENGPFKDLFNFCERVDLRKVNRRVLETLIKSGSLDSLGKHRATLLATLNNALQFAEQASHNQLYGQHDLLGMHTQETIPNYIDVAPWNEDLQLQGEKDTLGFYLTGHPLNRYLKELENFITCRIGKLDPSHHQTARVAGIITNIRTRQTRRGDRIGIFTLDDNSTQIEVVCFAEIFQKYRALLNEDQLLIVEGEVGLDDFNQTIRIVSKQLYTLEQARHQFAKYLQINLNEKHKIDINQLKELLVKHLGGSCPVIVRFIHDNVQANIKLGTKWLIKPSDALLAALHEQLLDGVELIY